MLLRVFPNKNSIAACLLDKFNSIQFTWMLNEKKRSALEMAINKWILVHYFHGMTFFQATIIFEFWINWCQKHFNRCVQPTENPFSWYTLNPNTITKMIFQLKLFCCKMYYNKKSVRYDLWFEFEWHFFGTKYIICTRELTFNIEMSQFEEESWL